MAEVVEVESGLAKETSRLVYVGGDGDVYEAGYGDGNESEPRRLTWGWSEGEDDDGRLQYVWPSYSPDGSHVACFGVGAGESAHAGLYAVAEDGVAMHEIWRMYEAVPICESWSSDSRHIALLLQNDRGLALEIADIASPGKTRKLDGGAPLFWSWSPAGPLIAVHTGGSRTVYGDARMSVFRIDEGVEELARLEPGEFRTPSWSPDGNRVAYVEARGGDEFLAFYRVADGVSEIVCPVEGHTVMLWSPDGTKLAMSQALGDTPHLFSGVTLVDACTGARETVNDNSVVSFFWSPCSQKLVSISLEENSGMDWTVFDVQGMKQRLSSRFYPSRESVYFCWFFDQFASSHPLVSPDGQRLVFAGHMADPDGRRVEGESSVYLAELTGDGPVERLADGQFACWDTRLRNVSGKQRPAAG